MNYFDPESAAYRYSKGRPDFHSEAIQRIKKYLDPDRKLNAALDVACGTGLSTKALLEIASVVYGTDTSREMLRHAPHADKIRYLVAPAEQLPFADDFFDLLTVCSGVHWFDIDQFLREANRVLKSRSWLVLYDNYFEGDIPGNGQFRHWYKKVYQDKFPAPPRNNTYPWSNTQLGQRNFNLFAEETFSNTVTCNRQQLMLYFTTQSNITAAVECGQCTYDEIESWLSRELEPFFNSDRGTQQLCYNNWIKYLQRVT